MAITPLAALDRTSSTFRTDVDTFFGSSLPIFVTESNAQAAEIIAAGLLSGAAVSAAAAAQEAAADAQVAAAAVGVAVDWANNIFATGTRMPFAQSAAPTGWTQDFSDNAADRMLRVVNHSLANPAEMRGGAVGGNASHSPVLMSVVPSHTHSLSINSTSTDHIHSITDSGHQHGIYWGQAGGPTGPGVSSQGGNSSSSTTTGNANLSCGGMSANSSHSHSGSSDGGSSATNWQPRYINLIICTKN